MDPRVAANRKGWDSWARVHAQGTGARGFYPIRQLLAGKRGWETRLPDDPGPLRGKTLLHLQCHIGMDSLALAKRGARVTGVDYSPEAVRTARSLSARSGVPARFVESDVYALPRRLRGTFDVVFTSYGTICWLPDLARWARMIARFLKPGGYFYIADSHPAIGMLEFDGPGGRPRIARPYFWKRPARYVTTRGTYADTEAETGRHVMYEWNHTFEELVGALVGAGLTIDRLREYPYMFFDLTAWNRKPSMVRDRRGWWRFKGRDPGVPLMFCLGAVRCS
ncbi:MAG: class I SAM-dependent methyltransferase [bacterium]